MKVTWKPGNMLYPIPAVLISTRGTDGKDNLMTVAWTGTVCTNPPMLYISVRKNRYSYRALHETGVFGLNLTTEDLAFAADYCGVVSGKDHDKFRECRLTKEKADLIDVPLVAESPVTIECRIAEEKELGSHVMMTADVLSVHADSRYMDSKGRFALEKAKPIVYSHGTYFSLGKEIGTFGYSVRKK
jgi:flavin reductase (DIM6/NTAB) family NADH-FMN oxidoreductase RutF